jgi:hypothetical protein
MASLAPTSTRMPLRSAPSASRARACPLRAAGLVSHRSGLRVVSTRPHQHVAPSVPSAPAIAPRPTRDVERAASIISSAAAGSAPAAAPKPFVWGANMKDLSISVGIAVLMWFIPPPAGWCFCSSMLTKLSPMGPRCMRAWVPDGWICTAVYLNLHTPAPMAFTHHRICTVLKLGS